MQKRPSQAPSLLRNQAPPEDRTKVDEAYNTEAVQYILGLLSKYIDGQVEGHTDSSDSLDKYNMASWPFVQADSVGFRRALRNLKKLLVREQNDR